MHRTRVAPSFRRPDQVWAEEDFTDCPNSAIPDIHNHHFKNRREVEYSWQRRKQRRSLQRRRRPRRRSSSCTVRRRRPRRLLTLPRSSIFLCPTPHHTSSCPIEHFLGNASNRLAPERAHVTDESSPALIGSPSE